MALSLGVSAGDELSVGTHDVSVKNVVNPSTIVISVDDGPDITITEFERAQILDEVCVFAGVGANGNASRLAFEALRRSPIQRSRKKPRM